MQKKGNMKEYFGKFIIYITMTGATLLTVLPLLLALIVSFTDEDSIFENGYSFFPSKISTSAYQTAFSDNLFFTGYKVTITITVVGTLLSLIICSMIGYAISVKKVKYRNLISIFIAIPMVFNAGLVPWYLVCTKTLHLNNTIFALILPMLVNPFNLFLLRNFFKSIPSSMAESAEIDGAGTFYTFLHVILPLAKPILATIVLFVSLQYWNDFTLALWLVDKEDLYPLQFILYQIASLISFLRKGTVGVGMAPNAIPQESLQMATFIITLGPIILVYPFVQKYFVKGIMIGAIKG